MSSPFARTAPEECSSSGHWRKFAAAFLTLCAAGVAIAAVFVASRPATTTTAAASPASDAWIFTGEGITRGISGLVLVERSATQTLLLAVHDAKGADEPRLTLLTLEAGELRESSPIAWPDEEPPIDLEAISRVPGRVDEFLVLASSGHGRIIILAPGRDGVTLRAHCKVPNATAERQFEGFDLRMIGSRLFACWGDRGAGEKLAELFWASFDLETLSFGPIQSSPWRAPWPREHQRHLSDLRLREDGALLVTAAADPGDDGPFAGAVYIAGSLHEANGDVTFTAEPEPTRRFSTTEHKIEALELIPDSRGGFILGADDENHGGAILLGMDFE